jgi:hypothetical protein
VTEWHLFSDYDYDNDNDFDFFKCDCPFAADAAQQRFLMTIPDFHFTRKSIIYLMNIDDRSCFIAFARALPHILEAA